LLTDKNTEQTLHCVTAEVSLYIYAVSNYTND